ncbi:MAG: NEW3 domain-containing protein [Candidatus Altiarchaeota archaeon]|nr:NEW3 domain-containing protein [Candidatus Altiarchaeota archaeon]
MKTNKILIFFCIGVLFTNIVAADVRIDSYYLDDYNIEAGDEVKVYVKSHRTITGSLIAAQGKIVRGEGGQTIVEESPDEFYIVTISPDSDISEEYIIISNGEKQVGHIFVGESWVSKFEIKMMDNAPAADYDMIVKMYKTGEDYKNREIIFEEPFTIEITGTPNLDIDAENTMGIGSTDNINLVVSNKGGGVAKNVEIELGLSAPFTPIGSSTNYAGTITANESVNTQFKVSVSTDAEVKTHEIPVIITYTNDDGNKSTMTTSIGVQINSKPKLFFGLDEVGKLAPGVEGNVILSISNEGFVDAKFLKFTLEPTDDYEVLSINEIYIGNLDSDDIETEEFTIKISDNLDLDKTVIPMKVTLRYKGTGSDTDYVIDGTININIQSKTEYLTKTHANGTSSMVTMALLAIPAVFIGLLALWFVYKLFGLVTGFINRKLFVR